MKKKNLLFLVLMGVMIAGCSSINEKAEPFKMEETKELGTINIFNQDSIASSSGLTDETWFMENKRKIIRLKKNEVFIMPYRDKEVIAIGLGESTVEEEKRTIEYNQTADNKLLIKIKETSTGVANEPPNPKRVLFIETNNFDKKIRAKYNFNPK